MKKIIILLLITILFSSCIFTLNDYAIVERIERNKDGVEKYYVTLRFNDSYQYLVTDSSYAVYDTIWLVKNK